MDKELAERFERLECLIACGSKTMLTTEEAADYMGCTRRTVRELARQREIPHYKDPRGRLMRFKRTDLDAWMQHLRIDTQQEMEEAAGRHMINHKLHTFKIRSYE